MPTWLITTSMEYCLTRSDTSYAGRARELPQVEAWALSQAGSA